MKIFRDAPALIAVLLALFLGSALQAAELEDAMKSAQEVLKEDDARISLIDETAAQLQESIRTNPDSPGQARARLLLARLNIAGGHFHQAVEILDLLKEREPEGISQLDVLTHLVHALHGKGDYLRASEVTDLLLDNEDYVDDPRRPGVIYETAYHQETVLRNYKEAAALYRRLLEEHPEAKQTPGAAFQAGYVLEHHVKNLQDAVKTYLAASTTFPDYSGEPALTPGSHSGWSAGWRALNLAGVLNNNPQTRKGLADYGLQATICDQLAETFPDNRGKLFSHMMNSAMLQYGRRQIPNDQNGKKPDVQKAVEWARKATQADPEAPAPLRLLAQHAQENRPAFLIRYLEKARSRQDINEFAQDIDDLALAKKALETQPDNVSVLSRTVMLSIEAGQAEQATPHVEKLARSKALTTDEQEWIGQAILRHARETQDLERLLQVATQPRHPRSVREKAMRAGVLLLAKQGNTGRIQHQMRMYVRNFADMHAGRNRPDYEPVVGLWPAMSQAYSSPGAAFDALKNMDDTALFRGGESLHEMLRWEMGRLAYRQDKPDLAARYFTNHRTNDDLSADCWMHYFDAARAADDVTTMLKLGASMGIDLQAGRWQQVRKQYINEQLKGNLKELVQSEGLSSAERELCEVLADEIEGTDLTSLRNRYNEFLRANGDSRHAPWTLLHVARILRNAASKRRLEAFGDWLMGWTSKIEEPFWKSEVYQFAAELYRGAGATEAGATVDRWSAVGPFLVEGDNPLSKKVGPEEKLDLNNTYTGVGNTGTKGDEIGWMEMQADPEGFVDFAVEYMRDKDVLACAASFVESPSAQKAYLYAGLAGPATIWLNGEEILTVRDPIEPYEADAYMLDVNLEKGVNTILVKSVQEKDSLRWGVSLRFGRIGEALTVKAARDAGDTQKLAATPSSELKMYQALEKAAEIGIAGQKAEAALRPFETLWDWGRSTQARGGYRARREQYPALAQEKLAMSYYGWKDKERNRQHANLSRDRFLREMDSYLDQYAPNDRTHLFAHFIPNADGYLGSAFDHTRTYLQQHPGDWPLVRRLWERAARSNEGKKMGTEHALNMAQRHAQSPWIASMAVEAFKADEPELLKVRYEGTGLQKHKLQWIDSRYDLASKGARQKVQSLQDKRQEYMQEADKFENQAKEAERLARQKPREAQNFEQKAQKAEQEGNEEQAEEFRAEAEKLHTEAKEHAETATRKRNMAKKLREAAEGYAKKAEAAQKEVGEVRQLWIENFAQALTGEVRGVRPQANHMRKMVRVDRAAASALMKKADISDWHGGFRSWYELGKEFQRWGDYGAAIDSYRQALTQPGGHPVRYTDTCFRWAESARKSGEPMAAETPLRILIRRFGDVRADGVKAEKQLCDLYRPENGKGNRRKYVAEVHRFLRRYPDQSTAYAELKSMQQVAEKSGDVAGVIKSLSEQISEAKSKHAREKLSLTRARTLYGSGQYYQAMRSLADFPPSNTEAAILRARCAWKLLDYHAALQYLNQARENRDYGDRPETTPPLRLLMSMSQFKTSQEHYAEAFELLDEARELLGDTITASQETSLMIARADVLIAQGDTDSALPLIKEVQSENKGQSAYWIGEVQMAKIDFVKERYAEAIERLQEVAKLMDPQSSPRALFWIGKTYLKTGKTDMAIQTFRKLWSNYGENDLIIQAIYLIGRTYRERGDFIDAINLFESVGVMRASNRTKVVPGEDVVLKVKDPDYAVGTGKDFMKIEVTTSSGDAEKVRLNVNPISTALFVGAIKSELGKPEPNSGLLELRGDDVVTVRYLDRFGEMTVKYRDTKIKMDRSARQARSGHNLATDAGTSLFSEGKVRNLPRLTDGKTEEPVQGNLDPLKNESFVVGTRFLRPHLIKKVRIHTGEQSPRKIRIEVLKAGDEKKAEEDREWITRKEIDGLRGAGWQEYRIPPVETRAVRIRALDHPEARGWRQINELEVIEGSAQMAWDEAEIEVGEATEKRFDLYVVDTGEIEISSVGFDLEEDEEEEEGWQPLAEEEEEEEEKHALNIDVARRRQGLITPGNTVFARLLDKDLDVSDEKEKVSVKAIALGQAGEGESVEMDTCTVVLTETEPHSGEFRGLIQTAPSGPTAGASDTAEGYSAGAAIDEDASPETAWQAKPDGKPGKWIEVDLKDLYEISEVRWSRGEGREDRVIQQGSITIYGGQETRTVPIDGNEKANDNVVKLDEPVRGRYIRLTADRYEGNAPAISQITIKGPRDNTLVPAATTPREMRENDVVELNVGDSMVIEYVDEENMEPGKPVRRQSEGLSVKYDTADVRVAEARYDEERDRTEHRETSRIEVGQVFQAMVQDIDEDKDDERQSVNVVVGAENGDEMRLEATETEGDSGTFVADIQTSNDPTARDAADKLYVEQGDAVWVNYVDERNMVPGHTITRTALAFEATPTGGGMHGRDAYVLSVPDFVEESLQQSSRDEEEITGPMIDFGLQDPDAAVSPFTRVPVYVGARNTRERRIIAASPSDLKGNLSAAIELAREQREESMWTRKELAFDEPMFTAEELEEWKTQVSRSGGERKEQLLNGLPLPVLGDDVIFFQYLDRTSSATDARIAHIPTRHQLREQLEEMDRDIPSAGSPAFLENAPVILLEDPETAITRQEEKVRKQYEALMGRRREMYEKMLDYLTRQQRNLSRRLEIARARAREEGADEDGESAEAETDESTARPGAEDVLATQTELAAETVLTASEMLQERLKKVKADVQKTQRQLEFYRRFEVPEDASLPATSDEAAGGGMLAEEEETGPYFANPVPGYPFIIRVEDPALLKKGEATVVIRSYLNGLRTRVEETATPAAVTDPVTGETRRVLQAIVKTDETGEGGALPVGWGGVLHVSYKDPDQGQPEDKLRRSYVAFASDGTLKITQQNFVDLPQTLRVGEPLNAVVEDPDRDVSFERDNLLVEATSGVGDTLVTLLSETAGRSGEFRGRIPTAPGKSNPNDAVLQCDYGGTITVRYKDYINTGGTAELYEPSPDEDETAEGEDEDKQEPCVELSAGEDDRGIRELKAVASLLPGSDGSVKLFARNLTRGRLEKETLFSSGYAHYMLGKNFSELGSLRRADEVFARAQDQFMELIRRYPGHKQVAHATFYLGNIRFVQENYQEAIRYYRNVLERAPKSDFIPQTRLRIGMAYEKLGKTQKAMEQYAYLTFHHPDSPYVKDAMVNLVLYFDEIGQEAESEGDEEARDQAFSRLVNVARRFEEKFPEDERAPRIILRGALRLINTERYTLAAQILEDAEENHADNSQYMPAFLYWHAEALLKGRVGEEPTERARVLLQRVVYDFEDTRYQRFAKARLVEIED